MQTNVINAFETVLSAPFGPTALTLQVEETVPFPSAPCYLVLDPLSAEGGREYILIDQSASSTSFTTSTTANRYLAGSSATGGITHPAGTVVRMSPMQQHIDDLNSRVNERLLTANHTRAAHEAMGIAHSSLSGLTTGDPHTQYLTSGRHGSLAHADKLTISPEGRRMTVGTSPHASPQVNDVWIDTNS